MENLPYIRATVKSQFVILPAENLTELQRKHSDQ